eukprot:11450041-Karenia_brevis.AAC.1
MAGDPVMSANASVARSIVTSGVRVDQSSGESVMSPSEMIVYNSPVTWQPVARPAVVMPYPMTNVVPVPSSSR